VATLQTAIHFLLTYLLLLLLLLLMVCAPSRHRLRLASATDLPGTADSVDNTDKVLRWYSAWKEASVPKTSSIRPVVSIQ